MDEAILFAKKFVEDLLSFFGLNTDVKATHEDEVIELSVPSTYLNAFLIGQGGDTLRSLQYIVSTALKNQGFAYNRVNLDIANYKRHRYDRIERRVEMMIADVRASNKPMSLDPMNPAERRIVHRTVGESRGVSSHSEGFGRDRHVILVPEKMAAAEEEDVVEVNEEPQETVKPAKPVKKVAKKAVKKTKEPAKKAKKLVKRAKKLTKD